MDTMTSMYSWQEVQENWLGGGDLTIPADEITRTFNVVATHFGREWVEETRTLNGAVETGIFPTLRIVALGHRLDSLSGVANSEPLLTKIRNRDVDAKAELTALHLLRFGNPNLQVELEPTVTANGRRPRPDFRIAPHGGDWLYVEIKHPHASQAQTAVSLGLSQLTGLVNGCVGSFALEVFLRRDPTSSEIAQITSLIAGGHQDLSVRRFELPAGLGTLYWNEQAPGMVTLDNHGEPYRPALGATSVVMGSDEHRHITVRWPFTDERACTFLDTAAKQLPKEAAALVMIQTSDAVGAMKAWRALVEASFQPNIRTRISGVCLFRSGFRATDTGGEWRSEVKVIRNPHALISLPEWVTRQMEQFPSDEPDMLPA